MSTITQATPRLAEFADVRCDHLAKGEGSKLHSTYFEFRVDMPVLTGVSASEMSDSELLRAAESAGTFDFLSTPEEDGYNDLMPPRA